MFQRHSMCWRPPVQTVAIFGAILARVFFYGSGVFTVADTYTFRTMDLDAAFISDLNAALGRGETEFAFGGRLDPVRAGVPEPATWAMFLLGFGAIGWTLRGNRRKAAVTA
jgi:hypothetical protein